MIALLFFAGIAHAGFIEDFLGWLFPSSSFAPAPQQSIVQGVTAPTGKIVKQVDALSTYNQKVWLLDNNKLDYKIYAGHINYFDSTAKAFKDINTALEEKVDKDGKTTWEISKASYHAVIPEFSDLNFEFENDFNGMNQTIKAMPIASHIKGEKIEDKNKNLNYVFYKDAFGAGIDLRVYPEFDGLKKVIVINKAPKTFVDLNFDFELFLPATADVEKPNASIQNPTAIWDKNSTLDFTGKTILVGKDGKYSYFRDARIWDSKGMNLSVNISLYKKNGNIYLRKTIPASVLQKAVYPLYTDHPTSYYAGGGDGYVQCDSTSGWSDCNNTTTGTSADYSSSSMQAGVLENVYGHYTINRAFFPIDTSGIADAATITAASFYYYVMTTTNDLGADFFIVQTTQSSSTSLSTSDFNSIGTYEGSAAHNSIGNTGYSSFSLNTTGISWVNKTGYTLLGLRATLDITGEEPPFSGSANASTLYTSENGSNTPYLDVTATDVTPPDVGATNIDSFSVYGSCIKGTGNIIGGTATDSESGIDTGTCEYTASGGSNWGSANWSYDHCVYSNYGSINDSGNSYTFNTRVKDYSANQGTGTATSTYTSDNQVPSSNSSGCESGWYSGTQYITLGCNDDCSGCASTTYDSGSGWTTYSSPFQMSNDGNNAYQFYSTDNLGNLESYVTRYCAIDTQAPSMGQTTINGFNTYNNGATDYIGGTGNMVGGTASDSTSGLATGSCYYSFDSFTSQYPASWNSDHCEYLNYSISNGNDNYPWSVNFRMQDNAGNYGAGTASTPTYITDITAPTIDTPTFFSDFNVFDNISGHWINSSGSGGYFQAHVNNDAGSGIGQSTCEYTANNGSNWNVGSWDSMSQICASTGITVSNKTLYNFGIGMSDNVANFGSTIMGYTYIGDTNSPLTTSDANDNVEQNFDANVHLVCHEDTAQCGGINCGSGCLITEYKIDAGDWLPYDQNILFSENGTYTLDFNSTDNVGNIETTNEVTIKINKGGVSYDFTLSYPDTCTTGKGATSGTQCDRIWLETTDTIIPINDSNVSADGQTDTQPLMSINFTGTALTFDFNLAIETTFPTGLTLKANTNSDYATATSITTTSQKIANDVVPLPLVNEIDLWFFGDFSNYGVENGLDVQRTTDLNAGDYG